MIRQYEGMFLVGPSLSDGDKALEPVKRILDRAAAEVLVCKKWDERKLAFEVARQKRGVYVLTYFKVDGVRIPDIERDVQLSEEVLRVMVVSAEKLTAEQMNKPTPSETGHSPQVELSPARQDDYGPPRRREQAPREEEEAPSIDIDDAK